MDNIVKDVDHRLINGVSITWDLLLGSVFLICMVLGVPANLTSCYYFFTRKAKNANALFFNRIYTVISTVDCLICAIQFPVLQVLFYNKYDYESIRPLPTDDSLLFNNGYFCSVWTSMWGTLSQTSVLLVAVLSLSRLSLLLYPRKQLSPLVAWIVPVTFAIFIACFVYIGPLIAGLICSRYSVEAGLCMIKGDSDGFWPSKQRWDEHGAMNIVVPKDMLRNDVIFNSGLAFIMGLPIIPITLSFALSMWQLNKALKTSESVNGSTKQAEEASRTVVLVTSSYLVCNIPTLLYTLLVIYQQSEAGLFDKSQNITIPQFKDTYKKGMGNFQCYILLIGLTLLIVVNSTLNPLVYFWRIPAFRSFVLRSGELYSSNNNMIGN